MKNNPSPSALIFWGADWLRFSLLSLFLLAFSLSPLQAQTSYDFYICGTRVTSANAADILGDGVFRYNEATKTLTVSGDARTPTADDEGEEYGVITNNEIEDLTIYITKDLTLESGGEDCIYSTKNLILKGEGKLTLYSREGCGIWFGAQCTIEDMSINSWGDFFAYDENKSLVIRNSDVEVYYAYGAIYCKKITLEGCYIALPANGTLYDDKGDRAIKVIIKKIEPKPFAVWSADSKTLYFGNGAIPDEGAQYTAEDGTTVTATSVWSGTDITSSPTETVPAWNTTASDGARQNCQKVVFQPSFATVKPTSLYSWFYSFSKVNAIEGLENFDTSEATTTARMFGGCSSITTLDLYHFDTSKVTDMSSMFYRCTGLLTIYCADTWSCPSSSLMFGSCTYLRGAIAFKSSNVDVTFANPDTGYFTRKAVKGDVNGDGQVNIADMTELINVLLGRAGSAQ